jgi:hypothetical protein
MAVEADVRHVIADWDEGRLARGDVLSRLIDLLTATNIDEVVAVVPDEWRQSLVDRLHDISEAEGELITVFGGIHSWELERDPVRRAEMQAEIERDRTAERAQFEAVILPTIRAWAHRSLR